MAATKPRKKKTTKSNFDVYEAVTTRVIEALEKGVVPWRRPWVSKYVGTTHRNLTSGKPYRGVNPFLLDLTAATEGYSAPYWVTFKQARDLAYSQWLKDEKKKNSAAEREFFDKSVFDRGVRKGEKSTLVVFWKSIKITEQDAAGKDQDKMIPLLRHFSVFNVEQCDGVPYPAATTDDPEEFEPIAAAQKIIKGMPNAPKIKHGGDRAFYSPMMDSVTLPHDTDFSSPEHYYGTAFHELVHATGHESRLGRIKDWATFGSEPYAQEELVAEMGAAMLCGVSGVAVPVEHSAAYCASWLKKLKDDKKFVVMAASKAQRAADFILDTKFSEEK